MERATTNIGNKKIRAYFEDVTDGKNPSVELSAEEFEEGINQFDVGLKKALQDTSLKLSSLAITL